MSTTLPVTTRVTWSISRDPRQVAAVRRLAIAALSGWGLAESADTAALILSELTTNAIVYSASPARASIGHDAYGGLVHGEVSDQGTRWPVEPPPGQMEELGEGGRGLWLVGMLATRWGVTRHADGAGKCVWFVVDPRTVTE
jgi:anti-sigma regulatory factor (Ser/Thr protein kinase)